MKKIISVLITTGITAITGISSAIAVPQQQGVGLKPLLEQQLQTSLAIPAGKDSSLYEKMLMTEPDTALTASATVKPSETNKANIKQSYGQQPMHFEPNMGQADEAVMFTARGQGYTLFLTGTEAVFSLQAPVGTEKESTSAEILRMQLLGKTFNAKAKITGLEKRNSYSNYYFGNDEDNWQTSVPHYSKVEYQDVYPGIDLVYYGNPQQLEYDFVVAPGADPDQIQLAFEGADEIAVAENGNLNLTVNDREVAFKAPVIYQIKDGEKEAIAGHYTIEKNQLKLAEKTITKTKIGFQLAAYDASLPLVIDPVLEYSTYLGGSNDDRGLAITVDLNENIYVTGRTDSNNFPQKNVTHLFPGESEYAFVARFDSGGGLVYSTYLGGAGSDRGVDIAVNAEEVVYVIGNTYSPDFPIINALDNSLGGEVDTFVTHLDSNGQAIYSTYFGGEDSDLGSSIVIDIDGHIYITGTTQSNDFPVTNAIDETLDGGRDGYITHFNNVGEIMFSTFIGGGYLDSSTGIAVDANGYIYITGETGSNDFPIVNAALESFRGKFDSFVVSFNNNGQMQYSTYLGGSEWDLAYDIDVDADGNACVIGDTTSTDFPLHNATDDTLGGTKDAFVTCLNSTGMILYSTYLGGNNGLFSTHDYGKSIAIDNDGNAYVTGYTYTNDFPIINQLENYSSHFCDIFITSLNRDGIINFSTVFGGSGYSYGQGIAADNNGSVYVTGYTTSTANFNTTANAFFNWPRGGEDGVVIKVAGVANQIPFATPQIITTDENIDISIELSGSDPNGDILNFSVVDQPVNGQLYGTVPFLTYVPNTNFIGADSFSFIVNDGTSDSLPAIVNIEVTPSDVIWEMIANYRIGLGTQTPGWTYLWNEGGPLGNSASYSNLLWNGSRYNATGEAARPTDDELKYGFLSSHAGHPGTGADQGSAMDRYVIAAYDISEAGAYRISNSVLRQISCAFSNGLDLRIYINDSQLQQQHIPGDSSVNNFDSLLGNLNAGDKVYVAVGPNGRDGCDGFTLDYSLEREAGEPANQLPVITSPGNQESVIDSPVTLTINASDPDQDTLNFSATGLPPGLSIDSQTGQITGTPNTSGGYSVSFSVSDGTETASTAIQWLVSSLGGDWQNITSYQTAFRENTPSQGWHYLWNANNVIGVAADYQSLQWAGYRYDSDGLPGRSQTDEFSYGFLDASRGHTGKGAQQGVAAERYVIAGYTVTIGGEYRISNSYINQNTCPYSNGLDIQVYVNDSLITQYYVPGDGTAISFDTALGNLSSGDVIYVGAGPNGKDGCDGFGWDFSIDKM